MALTQIQIDAACQQARQDITIQEAADFIANHHAVNRNTARDLVTGYRNMRNGTAYKRGLSQAVVAYYLECIRAEGGNRALSTALQSLMASIQYEEGVKNVNRRGLRAIYVEFTRRLSL